MLSLLTMVNGMAFAKIDTHYSYISVQRTLYPYRGVRGKARYDLYSACVSPKPNHHRKDRMPACCVVGLKARRVFIESQLHPNYRVSR